MEDYREIEEIEKKIKDKEREAYFSGKYDKGNALLSVFPEPEVKMLKIGQPCF